jgi:hypothetical protein
LIKNTTKDFTWLLTFVYGLVLTIHKNSFLQELLNISFFGYDIWLLGDYFNLLRKRSDKQRKSFNFSSTTRFNKLINDLYLFEMPLTDKKYTWAKSASSDTFTLLDRFFCSIYWQQHYSCSIVTSLARISSDHNYFILHTSIVTTPVEYTIIFDKTWLAQEGFLALFTKWRHSFILMGNLSNQWRLKL